MLTTACVVAPRAVGRIGRRAALLGSLAAPVFRLGVPGLASTLDEALQLPGLTPTVVTDAKSAFVTGLHVVAATAGLPHLVLGLLTRRRLPREDVGGGAGRELGARATAKP
ncbi:hypothetical protein [Streptomyces sp. SHP 1-2]|uniref:hypothetical protein n=1 Tax=Streptomyces sp. SHP 1-2 TaxID=2769489 RepID=UPI002240E81B|nr:hypothetical protein [Streptomyces sp. SHP 1-2]